MSIEFVCAVPVFWLGAVLGGPPPAGKRGREWWWWWAGVT